MSSKTKEELELEEKQKAELEEAEKAEKEEAERKAAEEAEKTKKKLSEEYDELIQQMVDDKLSKMKANVDKAYTRADELARENTRLKNEAKEAQRKQLENEGKHLEVAQLKIAELEEDNKYLNEKLTSTTRDRELEKHLGSLDFRNDFARDTAFRTILGDLVQDEDGSWIHKSGASVSDFVKAFAKDPDKDFLFKPKENTGAGSSTMKSTAKSSRPDSLQGLTTEELIKLAEEGKLGSVTY